MVVRAVARVIVLRAAALMLLLAAQDAQAGLEICNETGQRQSVAIGYKGDTDWTSEGWWNIAPGACATPVGSDLDKRYYYYFAESAGARFASQNYVFCTKSEEFTIIGDTDCEDRGYTTERFREIDTGETAVAFTLTMPEVPVAGSFGPGGGTVARVPVSVTPDEISSDFPTGRYGTPVALQALFQGCELEAGRALCGFHGGGRKLRAFYDGATPEAMLLALETMPVNTQVWLEGDRIGAENIETTLVLRKVTPRIADDADAALLDALQGDWQSDQDRRIGVSIRGSELYTRSDGDYRGARFLRLAPSCDAAPGVGPVLVQTYLKDGASRCDVIERADGKVLELRDPASGARLRYRADR